MLRQQPDRRAPRMATASATSGRDRDNVRVDRATSCDGAAPGSFRTERLRPRTPGSRPRGAASVERSFQRDRVLADGLAPDTTMVGCVDPPAEDDVLEHHFAQSVLASA
jgi:hypothetical protein